MGKKKKIKNTTVPFSELTTIHNLMYMFFQIFHVWTREHLCVKSIHIPIEHKEGYV